MVNEFNGFDKGVIGKKLPSDSTLNNMKKSELIKLLHIAEHNHSTLAWFYKNACDNSKCNRCPLSLNYNKAIDDFAEKLHGLCGFEIDDIQYPYILHESRIDEIAEQLKEGEKK